MEKEDFYINLMHDIKLEIKNISNNIYMIKNVISKSSENNDIIYHYCKQLPQLTELEREKKTLLKKITEKVYNECKHEWEKETCETSQLSSRHSSDEFKTYDIYFCNKCSLCKK